MNLPEEIDRDIIDFLDKIEHLSVNDQREALRLLFIKHLHLENSDFFLGKYEFNTIISKAKTNFVQQSTKPVIEDLEIRQEHKHILAIIEATIGELRHLNILHKIVKFKVNK